MFLDNDMTFDATTQRFYLTEYYIQNQLGIDLETLASDEFDVNPSTLKKREIEFACDMLWDFIEKNAVDKRSTHYYLACNLLANKAIKRALGYTLLYVISRGDLANDPINKLEDRIPKSAIQALDTVGAFKIRFLSVPSVENW